MYCKKCGKLIKDDAQFCQYCGNPVIQEYQSPKSNNTRKILYSVIALCTILVVVFSCILFFGTKSGKSYDDYMEEGRNYLTEQNYDAAEDAFLKAYEFDEKEPEVFSYLFVIYEKNGEEEKAQKIDTAAQQTLSEAERIEYVEKVKTIIEENNIDVVKRVGNYSNYEIIAQNIDDFDISPINVSDEYYIVGRNNTYYSVDENNNKLESGFESVSFIPNVNNKEVAWGYRNDGKAIDASGKGEMTGGLGGMSVEYYYLNGKEIRRCLWDGSTTKETNFSNKILFTIREGTFEYEQRNSYMAKDYYIYNPNSDILYGPYGGEEVATFSSYSRVNYNGLSSSKTKGINMYYIGDNEPVYGLFYEKTSDGYIVHSSDGTKQSDTVYEKAEVISNTAMKVVLNGKMGVLDENLNLVLYGDFEDVSKPINNQCYVKQNGKWVLIRLKTEASSNSLDFSDVEEGSSLLFGSYKGKQLSWKVIEKNNSILTLFCDEGVEEVKYCNTNKAVTWKESTICSWLNNDFFSQAFSQQEKDSMQKSNDGDYVVLIDESTIYNIGDFSNGWTDPNVVAKNGVSYWLMTDCTIDQGNGYLGKQITSEGYLTHTVGTSPRVDDTGIYARPVIYVSVKKQF